MAQNTGTLSIADLLAVTNQSILDYGLEPIQAAIRAELAAHNVIVTEMVGSLAAVTTERATTYGGASGGEMSTVDEYGRSATQKPGANSPVAFPLHKHQFAIGWTADWFRVKTPADLARAVTNGEIAHRRKVQQQMKAAIFGATNYTVRDYMTDNADLAVKRFVNADGAVIPAGPNAEAFVGSSHTHYDAIAWSGANTAQRTAAVQALIDDVVEHGHGAMVKVYINKAQEADVRALTGFNAYIDPRVTVNANANQPGVRLDISRLDNRAIGIFGAAEVWVKPWVPASYMFAFDEGDARKPLAFRQDTAGAMQGLRVAASIDAHPLYAEYMEAMFGVGVWTRTNGAVLYLGGGSYTSPTL